MVRNMGVLTKIIRIENSYYCVKIGDNKDAIASLFTIYLLI